ncbi:unnamed protein product [Sphagnum balticum]
MGTAMARNLVKAGYRLLSLMCPDLLAALVWRGASPMQTAGACDITFAMLADPAGAIEVACGEDGAVKGLGPGKGYVDVSTVDGDIQGHIYKAVQAKGAEFLESRFYLGEVGNGAAMKLVVNMIMGSMMASFSEGLVLGKKVGLDPAIIVEDLQLALAMAEDAAQPTPVAASVNDIYKRAKAEALVTRISQLILKLIYWIQRG